MIITILFLIATLIFFLILSQTKMVPVKYLIIVALAFGLVAYLIYFLTRSTRKKLRMAVGVILAIGIMLLYTAGGRYLIEGVNSLNQITDTKVELTDVGVYVRNDDRAVDIGDTVGYQFGIMKDIDRENVDEAIIEINKKQGVSIEINDYDGLEELVRGLLDYNVDAILLNKAFLDILTEIDGFEDIEESIRELHVEQIEKEIEIEKPQQSQQLHQDEERKENTFSVFISGIDSRGGLIAKSRSDVNIIATVNMDTRQILLVSTPRDYFVPLSISNGEEDKLTHAGIYGIDVCVDTMEMLYEREIDYYFRVNFSGFENIIDAVDGITVNSDYTFTSSRNKEHKFVKGKNQLNGAEALSFVRERHAFAEGDRQRGKNQLEVVKGVADKLLSPILLKNFSKIMDSISGSFETNIPYDFIAGIVRSQLNDGGAWNIVSYSVDGNGAKEKPYSLSSKAYVMIPDYSTVEIAKMKMDQIENGDALEE